MNHIKLFEEFKIKPRAVDVPVYSTCQRPVTINNKKVIRKQDVIVATDDTIKQIVESEIDRLGKDADLNHIDTSKVTNMMSVFAHTDFQGDVSQWDVSSVESMYSMFYGCSNFNCDISSWDVSKVKDMSRIFEGCTNFNQDLSKWNTSNVYDMYCMFAECINFNQDISNWNVSKVKNTYYTFYKCPIKEEYKPKFKQL